jgi:hypothetical protein
MKKMKLVLDAIEISSFEVSGKTASLGTVEGNQFSLGTDSCAPSCVNYSCEGATCTVVMC